ncbi:hypothetical protein [Planctomycetes bacterium CA13]
MSGNNYHVDWHPTDPNVLFLGPNMKAAYRSGDQGQTYETILDWDASGAKEKNRGPIEIEAPDFSHQNPDFGFCTVEDDSALWKTTDRGRTWTKMTSAASVWEGYRLGDVSVDPTNDHIWYVGSGAVYNVNDFGFSLAKPHGYRRNKQPHQARIWKSTDKGDSWTDITPKGLQSEAHITKIIVNPETPSTLFAATTYGFYKSLDGGSTWTRKDGVGFDHDIIRSLDMHHDKRTGDIALYAIDLVKWKADGLKVVNDGGGVFKSVDGGESWAKINGNMAVNVDVLCSDYSFRKTYYDWAIARWFGVSEKQAIASYPEKATNLLHRVVRVRVDPNDPNKVFVMNDYKGKEQHTFQGGIIWRSDDGGKKWFVTFRNGTAWEGVHKAYWKGRGNPTSHNVTWAAQSHWKEEGSYFKKAGVALAFNADGSVIACQMAKLLMISKDGGDTWEEIDEVETSPESDIWVSGGNSNMPGQNFYQDERLPESVFFCTGENDYWVTRPGGDAILKGVQAAQRMRLGPAEYSCSSVALHPRDVNTVYTLQFRQANRGELLRSIDGGKTFSPIGTPVPTPWPVRKGGDQSVHQQNLTIDPVHPENMYFNVPRSSNTLCFVGDTLTGFGMHKSSDGGLTWKDANQGLPATLDVANFRMDPQNSDTLYAAVYGKNGGLFKSTDRAEHWTRMKLPQGITSVVDIHFSKDQRFYISCGHKNASVDDGGVFYTKQKHPVKNDWIKIFHMPWTGKIKTAAYDPNIILVACLPGVSIKHINPGAYLSEDGGKTWVKINIGNGQSDQINDVAIDLFKPDVYYLSTRGTGHYRGTLASASPTMRSWKDKSGRVIEAILVSVEANIAVIRRKDGRIFRVPIETFCDVDRAYISKFIQK